jgi:glycerophosphoryl diester phosphodiesterase
MDKKHRGSFMFKNLVLTTPLVVGHRGARTYFRENTLESFQKTIDLKADMIEFDIRKTKDGHIVVFHDDHLDGNPLSEMTYEEIKERTLKENYLIPTFEELLKMVKGKIKLDIELKEEGYEKEVMEIALRHSEPEEMVVTSFNNYTIRRIKKYYPQIQAGLLLGKGTDLKGFFKTRLSEIFFKYRIKKTKADFIVIHWSLLPFGLISRARKAGIPVLVWTVNKPWLIRKLTKDNRVSGIITDIPCQAVFYKDLSQKKREIQDKKTKKQKA